MLKVKSDHQNPRFDQVQLRGQVQARYYVLLFNQGDIPAFQAQFMDQLQNFVAVIVQNSPVVTVVLALAVSIPHLTIWVIDKHGLRSIPGPFIAAFSDAWLGYWAARGCRSEHVHSMHMKYGTIIRIAPNHVSINESDALGLVYAHGNGATKSDFYDAFVSQVGHGMFNTRSRPEHTRKRKIVSHVFSPRHVLEFETNVHVALGKLINRWDAFCEGGVMDRSGDGWTGSGGVAWFDCLPWFNYLAFDIIGDLAFGAPFGMLDAAQDIAPVAVPSPDGGTETIYIPAVRLLSERGEYSASMGVLPPWVRPIMRCFSWYAQGNQATNHLTGMAAAAVEKRLADPGANDRRDLLTMLLQGKDEHGNPLGKRELVAEALTQMIAGSDTISNSSCGVMFYLAQHQDIQRKLQAELDNVLEPNIGVVSYQSIRDLPYLEACINESLRVHSISGIGLPRIVPKGGITICGMFFKEGTVLSVPSYSIHRDESIWGSDIEAFRPERWFENDLAKMQRTMNVFSYGPRACVGKNLAMLELSDIIATIFSRYDFVLHNPSQPFHTREGFIRKPMSVMIGMKRRNV